MEIKENISQALLALKAHKLRSFLTTLGIIIGVTTVIAMLSLIQGMNRSIEGQIRSLGSNTFYIQKFPAIQMGRLSEKYRKRKDLTIEDAQAVGELCPAIKRISPYVYEFPVKAKFRGEKTPYISLIGGTSEFFQVNQYLTERGRSLTPLDVQHRRPVVVLGADITEDLFPHIDPIGQDLFAKGHKFRVVGTLEPKGNFLGESMDDFVVIPITALMKYYGKNRSVTIVAEPISVEATQLAIDQATQVLRWRRGVPYDQPNDFEILTLDMLMDVYNKLTGSTFAAMLGIAAISLLVGGIGIMNIMLVSVTERTREIGIRKAIGAKRGDILYQFLIEAVALSGLGGILGIGLGVGIGKLVGATTPLPATIPIWSILLGFSFSAAVGIFFGIYPASKAAKLDPIVALRYE
jgi:putative ABC transport system permease protein